MFSSTKLDIWLHNSSYFYCCNVKSDWFDLTISYLSIHFFVHNVIWSRHCLNSCIFLAASHMVYKIIHSIPGFQLNFVHLLQYYWMYGSFVWISHLVAHCCHHQRHSMRLRFQAQHEFLITFLVCPLRSPKPINAKC